MTTFAIDQNFIYIVGAVLFGAGVLIPSPVQPVLKAVLAIFLKKPDPTKPGQDVTPKEAVALLPEIMQRIAALILSSPDSRDMISGELIRLLKLIASQGNMPGNLLEDLLSIVTQLHKKRADIDLSAELSAAWKKVSELGDGPTDGGKL